MDDFGKDVGKSRRLSRLIPAYRADLLFVFVTASNFNCVRYFYHDCLVVIGTWLTAESLLLEYQSKLFMAQ